jgi:small subunit ribosomal protein S8
MFQAPRARGRNTRNQKVELVRNDQGGKMDPIADMLSSIRNANMKIKDYVDLPSSKVKQNIVKLLKDEGYIKGYRYIEDNKQGNIRVYLKYGNSKEKAIRSIKRVSKPSRKIYMKSAEIPRVKGGVGTMIVSTSKGIMTGEKAREQKLGGEIICEIW